MEPGMLLWPLVAVLKATAWTGYFALAVVIDMPASYLGSLTREAELPIMEPGPHIVSGFDYGSIKWDMPWSELSCWYYTGHEPENQGREVDARTWAFRCTDFADTANLDGHETFLHPSGYP